MSLDKKSEPVVITVRPTIISTGKPGPSDLDVWHSRFTRPIVIAATMSVGAWLTSGISFWIAALAMLAMGTVFYRELLRAGLIFNRIVGAVLVLGALLLPAILMLLAQLRAIDPTFIFLLAVLNVGLGIGWIAHAMGLFKGGEPPCATAL
ncbi:hypothetical protein GCM10027084_16940 [Pseudoxanthomonas sangjuensis]|uniref:hypothetical protein n=1 Tax=Pseudoxanthomonas sangjuensis TaxID=1503750 RepID=UPI0013918DE7|nr:hypothetical protein [Pseudoxanthomonas sangjuensis]KAF1710246.1 hypothetical protein CSC71_10205 [Pseudoxanthomonas sangjuensis]